MEHIDTIHEVKKFNPYHDAKGRFTSANGGGDGGLQSTMFQRNKFKEVSDNKTVKDIVNVGEYGKYGIRIQDNDTETVGRTMQHHSSNFGGDFDTNDDLSEIAGELDGASAIDVNSISQVGEFGGYSGKVAYLMGSNNTQNGYDPGEIIMEDPVVLAKLGYKGGKLVLLDSVKVKQKQDTPKAKPETEQKMNPEYEKFMAEMSAKYGQDKMYSQMSDSEFDRFQYLESRRFDVGKSANIDQIVEVGM